jgi:acyl-coenzyme A thioesterase PaaI-like protein
MIGRSYSDEFLRTFGERGAEEFISRGHPTGDILEAWRWRVTKEAPGRLSIRAPLADRARNVKGHLFGGFTPVLLDLIGAFTVYAGEPKREIGFPYWLSTVSLRMDYFEPIASEEISIESRVVRRRGRICLVEVTFFDPGETVAAIGWLTMNVGERKGEVRWT